MLSFNLKVQQLYWLFPWRASSNNCCKTAARLASRCLMETRLVTYSCKLLARALCSGPASRLRQRTDEPPNSVAWLSVQTVYWFRCLLSAARTLRGDLRLLVANTSDVQGLILLYDGCKSSTAPAQNGLYVVAACCKITNTVGNTPIWGEKYKRGSFRKYKWCTRRNPSLHWLPEKWRNWGKGVRGLQWPDEICQIGSKWQNLKIIHDWFQFRWAL